MDQTASLDVLTSTSACSILSATPSKKKKSKYQSTRLKEKEDDDELHLVCVWKKKKKRVYLLYLFLEPQGQSAFRLICPLLAKFDLAISMGVDPIIFCSFIRPR